MQLCADLHVHYYPHFKADHFFASACRALNPGEHAQPLRLLGLAERYDCSFFDQLCQSSAFLGSGYSVTPTADDSSLHLSTPYGPIMLVAGWQINTAERLEILAVACRKRIDSGLSWQDTFARIEAEGGIAVINWAPGKWWFKRGQLIAEILAQRPGTLLCDTALRFRGYPRPRFFEQAKVICGSDPLPLRGEETRVGSYGLCIEGEFDERCPGASLRLLLSSQSNLSRRGQRLSVVEFTQLMWRYYSKERK